MVHGDESVAIGDPKHLKANDEALRRKYKFKTETLGCDIDWKSTRGM